MSTQEKEELYELLKSKPILFSFQNFNTNWDALVFTHNYENDDNFNGNMPDYRKLK